MNTSATVISLQDAAANRFNMSTTEELRHYLTEAGEPYQITDDQTKLRNKCLALVGLSPQASVAGPAARPKNFKAGAKEIVPPPGMRLDPNGLWGGRRWRVMIPKPEGSKKARAEVAQWNGKAPYYIPFNEVVSIPEPILNILRDARSVTSKPVPVEGSDGEFTTAWEVWEYNVQVLGVDPLTKDLPGSLTEYYQWKGPNFFRSLNTRELQTICSRLEIELQTGPTGSRRSKSDEELLGDILLFAYGDANAQQSDIETEGDED